MTELKPCPCCGREVTMKEDPKEGAYGPCVFYAPQCTYCSLTKQPINDYEIQVKLWNTRPIEDELRARVAEVESKNKMLIDQMKQIEHLTGLDVLSSWDAEA